jgi:phosphate transport system protein
MKNHTFGEFDEMLDSLKGELVEMAGKTLHSLERAMRGLMERDIDLCCAVVADDNDVDAAEKKIDHMGLVALTRFRPVATDLRLVIVSMKVAISLERIADHAVNIAKRARKMAKRPEIKEVRAVYPLYEMAEKLLRDALSSFVDGDEELALSLFKRDKKLDRHYKRVIADFGALLEDANGRSEDYVHLILIARSLERVGDLAVNISEDAVFLESAEDIRFGGLRKDGALEPSAGEAAQGTDGGAD